MTVDKPTNPQVLTIPHNAIIDGLVRQDERVRDGKMRSWELGHYVFPPGPGHTQHLSAWSAAE
jgi:hypothetical protein